MTLSRQLSGRLQRSIDGVTQPSGLPDRTFIRSRGCWNCVHAKAPEETAKRWFDHRGRSLNRAVAIALENPIQGEDHPQVVRIRRAIETVDQAIAAKNLRACDKGLSPFGRPVGDFVAAVYMCQRWKGATGHSLAAHDDGKPEILPEELRDIVDGSDPMPAVDFLKNVQEPSR